MLQVVCECGRIAEVRRRKNGQKLRYKVCANCGTSLGGIESAKLLEMHEKESIGEYGALPGQQKMELEQLQQKQAGGDWVPDSETMPEIIENSGDQIPKQEPEPKPKKTGIFKVLGWGLLAIGLGGLGVSVSKHIKTSGGAA